MDKKVSIIILNYNGVEFLKECIPSVLSQTYKNIEVLVVDNNSTDGSQEYLRTLQDIIYIQTGFNYGYSKANNIAAKEAKGEFLFFLNNDTELFPDTVEHIFDVYKDNSIVGPAQIIMANREFDKVGRACNGTDIFGYPYAGDGVYENKPFYIDGAGIFIKKTDFEKVGEFDEELFIFQEDLDLSWRAQIMGYKIIPCYQSRFFHYSGGVVTGGAKKKDDKYTSSYFRRYLNEKNVIRNIIKNYSIIFLVPILLTLFLVHLLEIILLVFLFQFKLIGCYIRAYIWNIRNISNTLRYRKKVQSQRVVGDYTIIKRMYFSYSKLKAFSQVGFPHFK